LVLVVRGSKSRTSCMFTALYKLVGIYAYSRLSMNVIFVGNLLWPGKQVSASAICSPQYLVFMCLLQVLLIRFTIIFTELLSLIILKLREDREQQCRSLFIFQFLP
jgi:hypothetical protein